MDTVDWLLESDPAIRWQAIRDLTDASAALVSSERSRVARQGIGTEILKLRQADGTWRRDHAPAWLTTLFTMQLLRATGIDPADSAVEAAMLRLENGVRWNDLESGWELRPPETGGNTFFEGEVEPCINGGALALAAYFGRPADGLAHRLIREQLEDGGWNCEAPESTRSSFHTTICVLEGLLEYERAMGPTPEVTSSGRSGAQGPRVEEEIHCPPLRNTRLDDDVVSFLGVRLCPPAFRWSLPLLLLRNHLWRTIRCSTISGT